MSLECELTRPFKGFGKYGFQIHLPNLPSGDIVGNAVRSRLYLHEDGKQIGEPHHGIGIIGANGRGNFVHWDQTLYFSASDGSNANYNGRRYSVIWSDEFYFKERSDYFHNVLKNTFEPSGVRPDDLTGKDILEAGCGRQHGTSLIMAGYGANVVAVDRFAPIWDEEFHPGFIDYLIRQGAKSWPGFDGGHLRPLLEQRSFSCAPFVFYPGEAETLNNHIQTKFDLQLSVAALEHFYDLNQVAEMLYQTAKSNCIGTHCVDFRDHRDFAKPLEFLLLDDHEYDDLSGDEKYVHGNRWRPKEIENLWHERGFTDIKIHIGDLASDEYMQNILPRLRASSTRFANEVEDTLNQLSITYTMRRP